MFKRLLSSLLVLSFSLTVYAESKPEGEGEEGAAKEKAPAKVKDELQDTRIEVDKRGNKVKAIREEIKKMMEEKASLPKTDVQKHSEIMKLIEEKYREYRSEYEDLQKARTRLRFRFPDKGEKKADGEKSEELKNEKAAMEELKIDSLELLEQESGLDAELTKSINLMRSQYKVAAPKKKKPKKKNDGHSIDPDGSDIITIQK